MTRAPLLACLVSSGLLASIGCSDRAPPIVDLLVDANRSGLIEVDDPLESDGDVWDASHGAVFLANLDDDDSKGAADASDEIVNGERDLEDLSPIAIRAWPDVPDGATAHLAIDAASSPLVRLFRVVGAATDPRSYTVVTDATDVPLTAVELAQGATFALEGRDFVSSTAAGAWTGFVQVTLSVRPSSTAEAIEDRAKLRVAPLLFQFNTAPTEAVYYTELGADTQPLVSGMRPALAKSKMTPNGLDLGSLGLGYDQWAQDFFDIGYTSKPGPGGRAIGMKIAVRSAQPDREAGAVTTRHFLGPDFGAIWKYAPDGGTSNDHGYSMNSFGNWDVIPPYTKGAESYPLGRNLWGAIETSGDHPDDVFQDFVRAQAVQPAFNIDTSWLTVGHVDEFTSWVKTGTPRGWGMLVASPRLARETLTALQAQGHGAARMFVGKDDGNGDTSGHTIDEVLGSMRLAAANQKAQVRIDAEAEKLRAEIGLDPSEVTEMPFLFETSFGGLVAYQPGTVNLLHVDGRVVIPDPFGPTIDGADPWKTDLETRLGKLGLDVFFADDWDTFHLGEGEVHCGTNVSRDMTLPWWTSGR